MLIRISLIVAIIAGLAVGTLNFVKVKKIIVDTRAERDDYHSKFDATTLTLNKTKADLTKTTAALDQTKKDLDATKKERDTAVAEAGKLKTPQEALSVAKDMRALQERVDAIEDEKKVLQRQLVRVQNELNVYKDPTHPITLPATLVGKVLVADPKWDFVVLSVGEDQGAQEHGEMLVNRDGRLVAKIKITSVQKDRCIANVLPGWKLGEVLEGDQVIPAYPAQS